jgi:hypothetical protein
MKPPWVTLVLIDGPAWFPRRAFGGLRNRRHTVLSSKIKAT